MITIYPGWLLIIVGICLIVETIYCNMNDFSTTRTLILITGCILSFVIFSSFLVNYKTYKIYSESPKIEKQEYLGNNLIKITTLQLIEKRDRNLFTGEWSNESTSSFEEKVINIRYENKIVEEVN